MADHSAIEWTDATWSPTTGCDRVSPGCDHCYALTLAKRLKGMGSAKYQTDGDPRTSGPGFGLAVHTDALNLPLSWRKPRRIFVNSMSDLFHDGVPDEYIARVFAVMAAAPQHTFQLLTKRHARMRSLLTSGTFRVWTYAAQRGLAGPGAGCVALNGRWPLPNVWLGVSVENQKWADIRIPALLSTPAAVRWLSCEPLLGSVNLRDCDGLDAVDYLDWVVAGGESGPGARPMHPDWPRSLQEQCARAEVPFFFKQWGEWAPPDHFDCIGYDDVAMGESGLTLWPDGRTVAGVAGTCADGSAGVWRVGKKRAGRRLDGRTWDEYPVVTP